MVRQRIERKDRANPSEKLTILRYAEAETCSGAGFYFESFVTFGREADGRFAWAGVMASIAGLAALLLFGWSQIEPDAVSTIKVSTIQPWIDPSSELTAAPEVSMQDEPPEELKRRGRELLRAEFPQGQWSPPVEGGDRLETHDATTKPSAEIATAGENDSVVAPAAFPAPIAASPPAESKISKAAGAKERRAAERQVHRLHARLAKRHHRDPVSLANAKYVQVREPRTTPAGKPQPEQAAPAENKAFGWVTPWPSWKDTWDNLWSKRTGE
jgi:hypothetical protein